MSYYLAYGMNTNLSSMATRCPAAQSLGKITLPGHKLAFKYFCDIESAVDREMECVLWNITDDCEQSLDAMTGRDQPAQPSESYLNMVTQGYSEHNINIMQLVTALEELTTCG